MGFLEQYLVHLGPLRTLSLVAIARPDPRGGGSGRSKSFPEGEVVDGLEELIYSFTRRRPRPKKTSPGAWAGGWGMSGVMGAV